MQQNMHTDNILRERSEKIRILKIKKKLRDRNNPRESDNLKGKKVQHRDKEKPPKEIKVSKLNKH
jgi:hypothetical protein